MRRAYSYLLLYTSQLIRDELFLLRNSTFHSHFETFVHDARFTFEFATSQSWPASVPFEQRFSLDVRKLKKLSFASNRVTF